MRALTNNTKNLRIRPAYKRNSCPTLSQYTIGALLVQEVRAPEVTGCKTDRDDESDVCKLHHEYPTTIIG
jgi:hypothetical protein